MSQPQAEAYPAYTGLGFHGIPNRFSQIEIGFVTAIQELENRGIGQCNKSQRNDQELNARMVATGRMLQHEQPFAEAVNCETIPGTTLSRTFSQ
jgi:hypothetical protein